MTADTARTNAYSQALQEVVNDGDLVVDIGTGPFVLLARQAVRAGAGRVFALEANGDAAKAAHLFRNTSSDSWTSKIELIEGASEAVTLPMAANVVVHELLGDIASRECAASILRDAFTRHVAQSPRVESGTWSVPARVRSWLVPAEMPSRFLRIPTKYRSHGHGYSHCEELSFEEFPFTQCTLASPQFFEVLDFARGPEALTGESTRRLTFVVNRPGLLAGFAIFITAEMTPQAVASADAAETQNLMALHKWMDTAKQAVADASETHDPTALHKWMATAKQAAASGSVDAAGSHDPSTFLHSLVSSPLFSRSASPDGIGFCSAWSRSSWPNPFLRLHFSQPVQPGDVIEVDATVDLTPLYPKYMITAALKQKRGLWPFEKKTDKTILNVEFGDEPPIKQGAKAPQPSQWPTMGQGD